MKFKLFLIILLMIISGIFFYQAGDSTGNVIKQKIFVTKIIDGDTIQTNMGKIRLKGINSPEKSMLYYSEANVFLRNLILNKSVYLENYGKDKYGRILGYIFIDKLNINKELIQNGLAHVYYYKEDSYTNELLKSEKQAREAEIGIWKKSVNFGCIKLIELKFKEEQRCSNQEKLTLLNNCNNIDVVIKDSATHIYKEVLNNGEWSKNFSCIWNNNGDSLYILDNNGLILFYRY